MKNDEYKSDFEKLLELSPWDALNLVQKEIENITLIRHEDGLHSKSFAEDTFITHNLD